MARAGRPAPRSTPPAIPGWPPAAPATSWPGSWARCWRAASTRWTAAAAGVYLHGAAGDDAAARVGAGVARSRATSWTSPVRAIRAAEPCGGASIRSVVTRSTRGDRSSSAAELGRALPRRRGGAALRRAGRGQDRVRARAGARARRRIPEEVASPTFVLLTALPGAARPCTTPTSIGWPATATSASWASRSCPDRAACWPWSGRSGCRIRPGRASMRVRLEHAGEDERRVAIGGAAG